jgi:ABC-type dipeptide/oligopeptide/nickel transport system permease subunit
VGRPEAPGTNLTTGTTIGGRSAATHDPLAQELDSLFVGPSFDHFLGTDNLGRDQFSRIVFGARTAVQVAGVSIIIGLSLGLPIGLMAGFWGGRRDEFLMRIMDALFAFPSILLALIILVALADSGISRLLLVSIAIGIPFVPTFARLIRGSTLSVKEQEYVIAAQSMGATDLRVASRHIFPNTLAPIIVQASLLFGVAVIVEAALSFLGLGTQPPEPSWGIMLAQSQRFMRTEPWLAIYPGIAISIMVLAFNLLGDVLRDLLDPRLRGAD